MEEQDEQVTVMQVAIKWGLILGIISIVIFLATYFGGFMGDSWTSWISPIFSAVIMYLAHKEFKDQGNGFMSYGQGLGLGTLMSAISGAVSNLFVYVYIKFINTDYLVELLDISREKMEEGGTSEDQIDAAMEMVEKFMSAEITVGIGLLASIFFGFIIALIVSAITKNNDPSLQV